MAWKTGKEGEKLRYGRVPEDVRPSAGQALYRFPVETSAGETCMLLSSQVYSFKSVSMADLSPAPLQLDSGRAAGGQQGFSPINTGTEAADDVVSFIFVQILVLLAVCVVVIFVVLRFTGYWP